MVIFLVCLRNPKSTLVELNLCQCKIGDNGACVIVRVLGNNLSLKIMDLSGNDGIKDRFWKVLIHVLVKRAALLPLTPPTTLSAPLRWIEVMTKACITVFHLQKRNENEDKVKVAQQYEISFSWYDTSYLYWKE